MTTFLRSRFNFERSRKKIWASYLMYFRNDWRRKTCLYKCLKSHVSVHTRTVNMLKGPKHCWKMHKSIFFGFFVHSERTSVSERFFFGKMESLTQPIPRQLSKKLKMFSDVSTAFLKARWILNIVKKKMSAIGYVFPKL